MLENCLQLKFSDLRLQFTYIIGDIIGDLKVNLSVTYRLLTEDVSIRELVRLTGFYLTKMENLGKLTMSGRKKKLNQAG